MLSFWEDEEVKYLFETVKQIKQKHKPLCYAFVLHANKYGRHHSSVKNYYYFELNSLSRDSDRCLRLGLELNDFVKQQKNNFSNVEKKKVVDYIDSNLKNGISVRKSCTDLAQGDLTKLQRYQNKYYNEKAKQKNINNSKVINFSEHKSKLSQGLTDSDINMLFLGLVRLIKREAVKDVSEQLKKECEFATLNYQKVISLLKEKENEVDKLKSINKTLNKRVEELSTANIERLEQ